LFFLLATGAVAQTSDPNLVWLRGGGGSSDAAWAPDGATFAFATHDGTIQVFDGETRFLVQTIPGPGGRLAGLDYAPDGQRIAAYSEDEVVGVWECATGEAVWTAPVAT